MSELCIVSSCLAGVKCRYDGNDNCIAAIREMVENGSAIPVCPEVLGGLPIPRVPAEIIRSECGTISVVNKDGVDVTDCFIKGAQATLSIAQANGAKKAILKSKSPSCGCGQIYDGTFTRTLKDGNGITTELLLNNGIVVLSSDHSV